MQDSSLTLGMTNRLTAQPPMRLTILLLLAPPLAAQTIDLSRARLVDLTHALDEKTLFWPTSPTRFKLDQLSYGETPGGWFYSSNAFSLPEHGGTHLDAPIHFHRGGATTYAIDLKRLVAPAVVIDVSAQAARDPDYRLTVADVNA